MLAQEEAKKFNHSYVGTEHLLLGIIGEGDNVVIKALQDMGFTVDQIRAAVEERLEYGGLTSDYGNIPFTQQAKQVLTYAWDEARKLGHNYVNVEHLFLSVFRDPTSIAARVLAELGVDQAKFRDSMFVILGNRVAHEQKIKSTVPTPTLDLFGRDLTWLAKDDKLDPVIGREKEIERIVQILSRRTKNNPVLTGEPGVGKTAIVEGLAQRIVNGQVPKKLSDKRVVALDLGLLVAGTKYRGEFEDRVKKVMEEVRKASNIIIFVDELHTIIGTGGSEGSLDAANLFKPALARGELQCVGATTLDEYRKHIEGDGALERRFQPVLIEEPTAAQTLEILRGIRERYETFHEVKITDEALEEAVSLSNRYITDRQLPDKAVDVIDEAASRVMLKASYAPDPLRKLIEKQAQLQKEKGALSTPSSSEALHPIDESLQKIAEELRNFPPEDVQSLNRVVSGHTIAEIVSNWTGIPVTKMTLEESKRILTMQDAFEKRIVGQLEAVKAVVRAVKRSRVGLKDPNRPTGSFLFLGPTGVGKSELAKTLAEFLFGDRDAMVRIDMSEYMEKHTVSRLIGAPPGYVGYNEGGQLTEPVRRKPYSVVLFDEIEKASIDVVNVLLQILEDGRVTDANGRTVSFKNTIVVMTSNVGAKFIEKESSFGFLHPTNPEEATYEAMKMKLMDELRDSFKPEFLNRIDEIVIFRSLTEPDIRAIVDIMLHDLAKRLKEQDVFIYPDKKVKEFLAKKGFDPKHGARPLRRAIQRYFEDKLADHLLEESIRSGIEVKATVRKNADEISFSIKKLLPERVTTKPLALV